MNERRAHTAYTDDELRGLSGWLRLAGLGFSLSAVILVVQIMRSSDTYERVAGGILLLLFIVTLYAFFTKRRYFPKLAIALMALQIAPEAAATYAEPSDNVRELIRAVFAAAIWIPYFVRSRRVKLTFVR